MVVAVASDWKKHTRSTDPRFGSLASLFLASLFLETPFRGRAELNTALAVSNVVRVPHYVQFTHSHRTAPTRSMNLVLIRAPCVLYGLNALT